MTVPNIFYLPAEWGSVIGLTVFVAVKGLIGLVAFTVVAAMTR